MKLAKVNEANELQQYPCSLYQVRQEFPNVSFPSEITQETLTPYGYVIVKEAKNSVSYDETRYDLTFSAQSFEGEWFETWDRVAVSAEETEKRVAEKLVNVDYKGFWKAFVRSNSYSSLKAAAGTDLSTNVLATELISIFSDAKAKNVDVESMQAGVSATLSALETIDPALKTETEGLLTSHGLDYYLPS